LELSLVSPLRHHLSVKVSGVIIYLHQLKQNLVELYSLYYCQIGSILPTILHFEDKKIFVSYKKYIQSIDILEFMGEKLRNL
jgi:hypothetical protein